IDDGQNFCFTQDVWQLLTTLRTSDSVIFSRFTQYVFIIALNSIEHHVLLLFTYLISLNQFINKVFNLLFCELRKIMFIKATKKLFQIGLIGSYCRVAIALKF